MSSDTDLTSGLSMLVQANSDVVSASQLAKAALEQVIFNMDDPCIVIDREGQIVKANASAGCLLEVNLDAIAGHDFSKIFSNQNWEIFKRKVGELDRSKIRRVNVELAIRSEAGYEQLYLWTVKEFLALDNEGASTPRFYTVVGQNVTELRIYQQKLQLKRHVETLYHYTREITLSPSRIIAVQSFLQGIMAYDPKWSVIEVDVVILECRDGTTLAERYMSSSDQAWLPSSNPEIKVLTSSECANLLERDQPYYEDQQLLIPIFPSRMSDQVIEPNGANRSSGLDKPMPIALLNLEVSEEFEFESEFLRYLSALSSSLRIALENIRFSLEGEYQARQEVEQAAIATVQNCLLPLLSYHADSYAISCHFRPADVAGGDWFLHQEIGQHILLLCGDVTGHGVASAMVTGYVAGVVKMYLHEVCAESFSKCPEKFLTDLANRINQATHTAFKGRFVMTMNLMAVDLEHGSGIYANAGHTIPWIISADGDQTTPVHAVGGLLGFGGTLRLRPKKFRLRPGERLFLYSDGLIENTGNREKPLRMRRLRHFLQSDHDLSDLHRHLHDYLDAYWQAKHLEDDVTTILFQWR